MEKLTLIGLMLGTIVVWAGITIALKVRKGKVTWKEFFSNKDNLKDLGKGVAISLIVVTSAILAGCTGTYNNSTSVYAGLDWTKNPSPMCEEDGVDERGTSNLGFKHNLFTSADKSWDANLKYTHHSCFIGQDDQGYDGVGIEYEYYFRDKRK